MNARIVLLPGDGIGPEVVAEGARVLAAVGADFGHAFGEVFLNASMASMSCL